jgi:hypothetical protein
MMNSEKQVRMADACPGERRAVRCGLARGLLLGCLVRVQVAEEVLLHEPLEAWS